MNVAIVGSRTFGNRGLIEALVRILNNPGVMIVSGGAVGTDSWAVMEAQRLGIRTRVIRPEWNRHGRVAGFERNKLIVKHSDVVFAFWDGSSSGTAHTIQVARMTNKKLFIYGADGVEIHI